MKPTSTVTTKTLDQVRNVIRARLDERRALVASRPHMRSQVDYHDLKEIEDLLDAAAQDPHEWS
jgi:hypothetical protein